MSNPKPWEEMTDADFDQIAQETAARDAIEPRARSVRYDIKSDAIVVELNSGVTLMVPTRLLQGVVGADPLLKSKVATDTRGYGIHFQELDEDFSVPGLLSGLFGNVKWMDKLRDSGELPAPPVSAAAEMGRRGGSRSTAVKTEAARANGRLGGRPRKKLAA